MKTSNQYTYRQTVTKVNELIDTLEIIESKINQIITKLNIITPPLVGDVTPLNVSVAKMSWNDE